LFDYKFNIVDENGNELVKGVRWLLGREDSRIAFSGISPDVMDLIDSGKAFVNPEACYLEYGKNNYLVNYNGRTIIENFSEVQLPMEKSVFICWNNKTDRKQNIKKYALYLIGKASDDLSITFANIPEKNYKVLTTEVTQKLYKEVMGENPSYYKGDDLPVENVSWYDAIYFCNKLSLSKNLEPVYSVNGETDVTAWNYTPHKDNSINGEITQNTSATGYRLPTLQEWQYAAKGGENYTWAGSDNLDEVGWYDDNSDNKTHPVAQKKPNGYGLYDMSGNVRERVWDSNDFGLRYSCGGCYFSSGSYCVVGNRCYGSANGRDGNIGFRLVCPSLE
jgi:formylglycine-generating enzyme